MTGDVPPLPPRDPDGHKGTFGTVTVFGGCASGGSRMIGAPALAALGALRAGAGRARLATPEPIINEALTVAPSATGIPLPVTPAGDPETAEAVRLLAESAEASDALVVGPGLGLSDGAAALALQAVVQDAAPVVVDADALTLLSRVPELQRDIRASAVLTPHPGEYRRLAAACGIDADPADPSTQPEAAQRLAGFLGVIVVLKGARTVVADGVRYATCGEPNPALAAGGSGDVLAGAIAGLIAAHGREIGLFDCAVHGVCAHAAAAGAWRDRAGATGGMLAADLAGCLPAAVQARRG